MNSNTRDVTIIGAGPAGLALAYCLGRLNVSYQVLERGKVGNSWHNMADSLRLISPHWVNILPGTKIALKDAYRKMAAPEFSAYLDAYRQENGIVVQEHTEVTRVSVGNETFVVATNRGEFRSRLVVSAAGYFSNPYYPPAVATDRSIPAIHACEYVNPAQVRQLAGEGAQVLIVGKRVTAGQLMVELADAGLSVTLSAASPVQVRSASFLSRVKEALYYVHEALQMKFKPPSKRNSYPPMDGGRSEELLHSGAVQVRPRIEAIKNRVVFFADGTQQRTDLVIYATGYRAHMPYLWELLGTAVDETSCDGMQSRQVRGLYFLGLDNLRNFRSRYLRGIKADAEVLAAEIARTLV